MKQRRAIIFIDVESNLEGPWRDAYDFVRGIDTIRGILARYRVPAVFNVCGQLLEAHAALFRALELEGHEAALHGWRHENLRLLGADELRATLQRAQGTFGNILGHAPKGFRAPWLDYDDRLTAWLSERDFVWTSHRHMAFRERFDSPGLRPELRPGRRLAWWWSAVREQRFDSAPCLAGRGLRDIPLTSSMDGELLGLVSPLQASPALITDYCLAAWMAQAARHRDLFTLNVHDWLMATANRPPLLAAAVAGLQERGFTIVTATTFLKELDADAG